MTTYEAAAVKALVDAALAVLDSPSDDEGGLLSVHWRRAKALCEAVAALEAQAPVERPSDWFRDGKEAAIQEAETGTKPENPHAGGSQAAQWWSRGYSYNWRQFNALRAARERDAAEGKVLPKGWRVADGDYERDVGDRGDLIYVRVQRGTPGKDGTWLRPSALILPVAGVQRGLASTRTEAHHIEADTVLAAIEAAEAWLKEHPR